MGAAAASNRPAHVGAALLALSKCAQKTSAVMCILLPCGAAVLHVRIMSGYVVTLHACDLQMIDDVLDFTGSSSQLGKPALNDINSGMATIPVLYAIEEYPELAVMVKREFKRDGDVAQAVEWVMQSQGIQKTKELAAQHCHAAVQAVSVGVLGITTYPVL